MVRSRPLNKKKTIFLILSKARILAHSAESFFFCIYQKINFWKISCIHLKQKFLKYFYTYLKHKSFESSFVDLLRKKVSWPKSLSQSFFVNWFYWFILEQLFLLNGIKVQIFFRKKYQKKHLCRHDKNYYYF